jgi:hypothetical protein
MHPLYFVLLNHKANIPYEGKTVVLVPVQEAFVERRWERTE